MAVIRHNASRMAVLLTVPPSVMRSPAGAMSNVLLVSTGLPDRICPPRRDRCRLYQQGVDRHSAGRVVWPRDPAFQLFVLVLLAATSRGGRYLSTQLSTTH